MSTTYLHVLFRTINSNGNENDSHSNSWNEEKRQRNSRRIIRFLPNPQLYVLIEKKILAGSYSRLGSIKYRKYLVIT